MRGLLIPSAICLFFMLVLSGCSYRLSADNIDIAAKQLITDFDVSFKGKDNSTVTSIGFKVLGEDSLAFNPLLLEESLNHYLSLSPKFKVIEYGKEKTDKLLKIITDQRTRRYLDKNAVKLGTRPEVGRLLSNYYESTGDLKSAEYYMRKSYEA